MVHAHVDVAGVKKGRERPRQHRHFGGAVGQFGRDDAPLWLEALRQVRIGIEGNAIWLAVPPPEPACGRTTRGLHGQSVDQVHIDRLKAETARCRHQRKNLLSGLDPVHGLLHCRVEILHAETQAIEAQLSQIGQAGRIHGAGVDLDRVLTARA
jgi:hypothetical protein